MAGAVDNINVSPRMRTQGGFSHCVGHAYGGRGPTIRILVRTYLVDGPQERKWFRPFILQLVAGDALSWIVAISVADIRMIFN